MTVLLAIMLLLHAGGTVVSGTHFRGGTFKWAPIGDNKVDVTYYFSFNGFQDGSPILDGHQVCNNIGSYYVTKGYLACGDGCSPHRGYEYCSDCLEYDRYHGNQYNPDMRWRCTEHNIAGNYDIGSRTFEMKVPKDTNKLVVYYNMCCWVDLVNVYPHENEGWKMFTEIDLNHVRNGVPNSSPISSPIPVQLYHKGCDFWFEIPVTDPDNDNYRCRNTERYDDECYKTNSKRTKFERACGELDYIHVFPNCTLHFDTHGDAGNYAVRVVIEDLDENDNPKSKVSLSFLLEVSPDSSTCNRPRIVAPGKSCTTIPVNEHYEMTIIAEAATAELPIDRIDTNKPSGMTSSYLLNGDGPLRKSKTLTWTPSGDQVGRHIVGFSAVDTAGFSSDWSSVSLNVVDVPPLSPSVMGSHPSRGEEVDSPKRWSVAYNRRIRRPTQSAYIILISKADVVVGQVDSSDETKVEFGTQNIIFDMPIDDFPGKKTYTLQIGEGVAIDAEYGDVNCTLPSTPDEWQVTVGEASVVTAHPPTGIWMPTTKPPVEPPIFKCEPGDVDISIPSEAEDGDKCFIHLTKTSFTVTSENSMYVPYKVCCPTTCESCN
ncbi:uncharacterized protein [Amphiura filiformis]|uniref:uncharacterized protein n=1 Tax=Amphiura filiformis TaxID=82378 RepID=UPI003B225DD0